MRVQLIREADSGESGGPIIKKIEYIVIADQQLHQVIKEVKEALSLGWKCQGGIAVTYNTVGGYPAGYYQAMIKE